MVKATTAAGASRASCALAALFLSAAAAAQSEPVVLSVDHVLTHPVTGAIRHDILPIAVYDGARFRAIQEWETPEAASLLTEYPRVHVLHRGERMGAVTVSDVHQQQFQCSSVTVGTGNFSADVALPSSECRSKAKKTLPSPRANASMNTSR